MEKGICYIISGGDLYGSSIEKKDEDYIIAADAGYRHLPNLNVKCDIVVGDFDSIMSVPQHEYLVRLKKEKDDTDTLAALRIGLERGYREFRIYGATGGNRFDHTMANIQSLAFLLDNDAHGLLYDFGMTITMIRDEELNFCSEYQGYISVMSYSEVSTNVTLRGLKYELENATLTSSFPIGTSNEFIGKESSVSVKNGTLFITYETKVNVTSKSKKQESMEQEK